MERTKITITIESGIIQDIEGIPENITIETKDFDVCDEDTSANIEVNAEGERFIKGIWKLQPTENKKLLEVLKKSITRLEIIQDYLANEVTPLNEMQAQQFSRITDCLLEAKLLAAQVESRE